MTNVTLPTTPARTAVSPQLRFWGQSILLSLCSGMLMGLAQPALVDMGWLAWIGLVPVLIALAGQPVRRHLWIALPCGILWSIGAHAWYPAMFGWAGGTLLIVATGFFYAALLQAGMALASRLPSAVQILGLPLAWTGLEFVRTVMPVVGDWWFEILAKTQWRFPAALQIVTLTGWPGLSFIIVLANAALAALLVAAWRKRIVWPAVIGLGSVALVLAWGWWVMAPSPAETVRIGLIVDLANQHEPTQQAVLERDIGLTRMLAAQQPQLVVWPENELVTVADPALRLAIGQLAHELNAYIVADMVWPTPAGRYDTAVLFGPDGAEVGRQAKINVTGEERAQGFSAGQRRFPVYPTSLGTIGLGVCYDRHPPDITRQLARAGARIVAMPADDDFAANPWFPRAHAADTVVRAVENRVAFAVSNTSGIALVVDPYGRITAESGINQMAALIGEAFVSHEQTLYTLAGDWFGWLIAGVAGILMLTQRPSAPAL